MLVEYKKKANKLLISGFLVWFLGNILKGTADEQNLQFFLGYALFSVVLIMPKPRDTNGLSACWEY